MTPSPCTALAHTVAQTCGHTREGRDDSLHAFARVRRAVVAYAACAREHRVPPRTVLHTVRRALQDSLLPDDLQRELRGAVADTYYAVGYTLSDY